MGSYTLPLRTALRFSITGIIGAVVMPHNLYLHTASCQSRRVRRDDATVRLAVKYSSWEPVVPVLVSFFINAAIVAVAAETVFGQPDAADVGLTDFCSYFSIKNGCFFFPKTSKNLLKPLKTPPKTFPTISGKRPKTSENLILWRFSGGFVGKF